MRTDAHDTPYRDGETYVHERDGKRLDCQHNRVFSAMKSGAWKSLALLSSETGDPEASISARLRDFRKPRFQKLYGECSIERRYIARGQFAYRLILIRKDLFE